MAGVGPGPRAVELSGFDPSKEVDAVEGVVGAAEDCFVAGHAGAEDVTVAQIDELAWLGVGHGGGSDKGSEEERRRPDGGG